MTIRNFCLILPAAALFLCGTAACADTLTITLTPSQNRVGAPGSTIYFGFDVFFQSNANSLLIYNSYLANETNPLFGTYTDNIGAQGMTLDPSVQGVSWTQLGGPATGAGSYAIAPLVPLGNSNSGTVVFDYVLFGPGEPTYGSYDVLFSTLAQNIPVSGVPEPVAEIAWTAAVFRLSALAYRRFLSRAKRRTSSL